MKAVFVGGRYHGIVADVEFVKKQLGNGKFTEDLSELRAKGNCVPRAELDNQPMVDGYLSPMWDGGKLRYETPEVYRAMSDY